MTKFFIYQHTNLVNGKIYIGKSNNPKTRWARHIYDSENYKQGSKQLLFHRAIHKYGPANFTMQILSEYDTDQESLIGEAYFIKKFQSNDLNIGYNLTSGGEGVSGYHRTLEECLAISKRNSGVNNGQYGKVEPLDKRTARGAKISETKKNKPHKLQIITSETIDKLKIAVKEKSSQKLSDEQKDEIISLYNSGNFIKRDLAIKLDVEEKTIQYIIRYWDTVKNNKSNYLTQDQKYQIIKLYDLHTMKEISQILTISFNRVEAVIKMFQRKNKSA